MPGSIPGLVKSVKEKKLPGATYIGSVTQLKDGEFVYEGITEKFRDWIKEQVEECRGKDLLIRGGWTIYVEDDAVIKVGALVRIKPDLHIWFDALESNLRGAKVPGGEESEAVLEYLDEAQRKESDEAWKKFWRSLDEHITWPEFIKRFPKLWESYKKRRAPLLKRVKEKYPEIDIELKESISTQKRREEKIEY